MGAGADGEVKERWVVEGMMVRGVQPAPVFQLSKS